MKLRIEDLRLTRSWEEQVDFLDMRQLKAFFIRWSQLNELNLYILLKGRGKFMEVWSSDGGKLLERYTRTDK